MKHINNKLLIALTLTTCSMLPHGGGGFGGGFATGALIGTGVTLAATSGSRGDRSPEYYEYRRDERAKSEIRRQIRDEERQLKKNERDLQRAENKNDDNKTSALKEEIKYRKQTIKDLREDLRNLR